MIEDAQQPWGLHWFRRDLRVTGNMALELNRVSHGGRALGFFCFDPDFLGRPDFSPDRFGFFLHSMAALRDDLRSRGGDLLVLNCGPKVAFPLLFDALRASGSPLPKLVTWNRDYEPFARQRDSLAKAFFESTGVATETAADHLAIEPHELAPTSAGGKPFFSVYSPFARRWFEFLQSPTGAQRIAEQHHILKAPENATGSFRINWDQLFQGTNGHKPSDALDSTLSANASKVTVPLPPAGHSAARAAVENFRAKVQQYGDQRDFPDKGGTSRLSIYLKNGSITSRQVIALLGLGHEDFKSRSGTAIFLKEIAWREFYYHILWHNPHVEHQSFNPAYKDIQWENNPQWFELWTQGQTGYPIVDAGMRELNTTGWMHNRVRMIVSSFLTKDLLIDWRWGERYFMQKLLDGDLAPNNGGWQWSASTGCDPQPYFRIFNPELQSRKFDPDGTYIARHVPELTKLAGTGAIHSPPNDLYFSRSNYVAPIVVHSEQRLKAMALFKQQ